LTSVCTGVALLVGLAPILERFALLEPSTIDRLLIYDTTLAGVARFLPWGSGPGTYPDIYPLFQPVYSVGFTNHAHNDYLELMFEMGLPGTALVVTMLLLYARQWSKVWVPGNWTTFRAAQVGAGIGVLLMALHSLTDFNQHIPANTVFLAFLAAVFWHRPAVEETGQGTRQRKSTNGRSPPSAQSSPATRPGVTGPAPASQPQVVPTRNPFMD
jgi:O-antigen ligase